MPRTPDGHPDLQGIWTNATLTPLERPASLAGKLTVTDAEAKEYENHDVKTNDIDDPEAPLLVRAGSGSGETAVGAYNNLFIDRGSQLARVDGVKRSSLIVDPADGKVPYRADRRPPARSRGRRLRRREETSAERAVHYRLRVHVRAAHDARALQQQLSNRADTGIRDDHGRNGRRCPRSSA